MLETETALLIVVIVVACTVVAIFLERGQSERNQRQNQRLKWIAENPPHFRETAEAVAQVKASLAAADAVHLRTGRHTFTYSPSTPLRPDKNWGAEEQEALLAADRAWFEPRYRALVDAELKKRDEDVERVRVGLKLQEEERRLAGEAAERQRAEAERQAEQRRAYEAAFLRFRYRLALLGITDQAEVEARFASEWAATGAQSEAAQGRIEGPDGDSKN